MKHAFSNQATNRRAGALAIALCVLPGVVQGCNSPTAPPPPPSGGAQLHLDYGQFALTVEPILERYGCDAGGDCHGGGIRGALVLSPEGAKDPTFDFNQVVLEVSPTDIDASPILTKPLALAAGGVPHAVKPFATTADTDYVAIRAWIAAGSTQ
jgi:hypothetical protein